MKRKTTRDISSFFTKKVPTLNPPPPQNDPPPPQNDTPPPQNDTPPPQNDLPFQESEPSSPLHHASEQHSSPSHNFPQNEDGQSFPQGGSDPSAQIGEGRKLKMQINGFCLALWLVGFLLMTFNSSSGIVNRSILVSGVIIGDTSTVTTTKRSRYLKENRFGFHFAQGNSNGDVSLEDYGPVDPSPSQASIDHGPIEHGSPSHPYIPKPKPPPPAPIPSGP